MQTRPGSEPSDDELVARVRAGDASASEMLVRRYREPLVGFATRLLAGDHHGAEDVVQDAMVRALAGLRATDRPMALRAWLHVIVRNRALDHLRVRDRLRSAGDEPLALVPGPAGDQPERRAATHEELARAVAEVRRLPRRQRLALVRREIDGAGHAELAAELGTTVPATKSLILRARRTLAETLAA